jgi:hypothetical protein
MAGDADWLNGILNSEVVPLKGIVMALTHLTSKKALLGTIGTVEKAKSAGRVAYLSELNDILNTSSSEKSPIQPTRNSNGSMSMSSYEKSSDPAKKRKIGIEALIQKISKRDNTPAGVTLPASVKTSSSDELPVADIPTPASVVKPTNFTALKRQLEAEKDSIKPEDYQIAINAINNAEANPTDVEVVRIAKEALKTAFDNAE